MSNKFTRTTPQKQLKLREKQTKSKQKVSTSVFQISISLTWLANLWNHARSAWIPKEFKGESGREKLLLEI